MDYSFPFLDMHKVPAPKDGFALTVNSQAETGDGEARGQGSPRPGILIVQRASQHSDQQNTGARLSQLGLRRVTSACPETLSGRICQGPEMS